MRKKITESSFFKWLVKKQEAITDLFERIITMDIKKPFMKKEKPISRKKFIIIGSIALSAIVLSGGIYLIDKNLSDNDNDKNIDKTEEVNKIDFDQYNDEDELQDEAVSKEVIEEIAEEPVIIEVPVEEEKTTPPIVKEKKEEPVKKKKKKDLPKVKKNTKKQIKEAIDYMNNMSKEDEKKMIKEAEAKGIKF